MSRTRDQLELFWGALRFFTRLPVPAWVGHSSDKLNRSARYFPAVGWLVGGIGAAVFLVAAQVLPESLAVLLSMTATLLATGGFHEDGLADAVDGFGGGYTRERVLEIMKDSRIGSFGAIALVLALAIKFHALLELDARQVMVALLVAHPLSRLCSVSLIHTLEYVREDALSRAKPLAVRLQRHELLIATVFGLLPLALLGVGSALTVLAAAWFTTMMAARYLQRRLGGYTGDCLGATQQLSEIACYLALHVAAAAPAGWW